MKLGYFYHKTNKNTFSGVVRDKGVVEFDSAVPGKINAEHTLEELEILCPVNPQKIIGVGLNYRKHAAELDMDIPADPVIFFKPPTALIPHGTAIQRPRGIERVDYEGELALVIKRTARNVSPDAAHEYILGYLPFNDVTAREKQAQDGQWARAKGYDTFAPCGPFIETQLSDPRNLRLQTYLNNQLVQDSHTSDMIYDVFQLLSYVSSVMTLLPGDVITTGTPSGIGPMQDGDQVMIRIEGMEDLINTLE